VIIPLILFLRFTLPVGMIEHSTGHEESLAVQGIRCHYMYLSKVDTGVTGKEGAWSLPQPPIMHVCAHVPLNPDSFALLGAPGDGFRSRLLERDSISLAFVNEFIYDSVAPSFGAVVSTSQYLQCHKETEPHSALRS